MSSLKFEKVAMTAKYTSRFFWQVALIATLFFSFLGECQAYTANKVWFEFRPNGLFRIHVNYTIPDLKEFRDAYIEFKSRKKAEKFYWDVVRGADFYLNDPSKTSFKTPVSAPEPW